MKTLIRLGLMMALCQTGAAVSAAMVFNTVGVYDADTSTFTNTVDHSASATTTGNYVALADFKTLVSTAYAGGYGGVVNFDAASQGSGHTATTAPGEFIKANYGSGFASSLNIQNTASSSFILGSAAVDRTQISGETYLAKNGTPTTPVAAQNFWFGFSATDKVVAVGATIISRGGAAPVGGDVTGTIFFSDSTSSLLTYNILAGNADHDTFFGFQITAAQRLAGTYIAGLQFNQGGFRGLDDLAFVVVPEPGKASLLMLGIVGGLMRRRR